MKEVLINIKGTQGLNEDEQEVIELDTLGTIEKTDVGYSLSYDESKLLGAKNILTTLTVGDGEAVMERNGEMSSRLVIKKGVRNNCFYSTPHGDLVIGIFGEDVECNINNFVGKILLSYSIDTNLQPVSKNKVEITVKEV